MPQTATQSAQKAVKRIIRACAVCGVEFTSKRPDAGCCSARCRGIRFMAKHDQAVIHRYLSARAKKAAETRRRRRAQQLEAVG